MPRPRETFGLGLTVIVVAALLFAALVFFGGRSFEPTVPLRVLVRHDLETPRLNTGAPIVCGPQQVGSVKSITLVERPLPDGPADQDYLFFEVSGEVLESVDLRADCRVAVQGQILGNQGQLVIKNRGNSSERVSAGDPVFAEASGFASDVSMITRQFNEEDPDSLISQVKSQLDASSPRSAVAKIHDVLDNLKTSARHLRENLDPQKDEAVIAKIQSILGHVEDFAVSLDRQLDPEDEKTALAKVHHNLDLLDSALAGVNAVIDENRDGIKNTISATDSAANRIDDTILPRIERELDADDSDRLIGKLHDAIDELKHTVAGVNDVVQRAQHVTARSEERVVGLIRNAEEASHHLKAMAKNLRRYPWRLIHRPDDEQVREAYLFDAVREFADASASLDASLAQLKALHEASTDEVPVSDETFKEAREELNAALERFSAAEEALWSQLGIE